MAKLVKIIQERLVKFGCKENDLIISEREIAFEIASYAHRNQKRINGESYINHPLAMAKRYLSIIYANEEYPFTDEAMKDNKLPHYGAIEVMLLHDVIEDTEYSNKDIKDVYEAFNLGWYYEAYIKSSLELITHDKNVDYETYLNKLLENPTASLVKMFDSMDNLNILSLTTFGDHEYERSKRYLNNIKRINDRYHYIEKIDAYLKDIEAR